MDNVFFQFSYQGVAKIYGLVYGRASHQGHMSFPSNLGVFLKIAHIPVLHVIVSKV